MIRICHIISGDLWAGAEVMALRLIEGTIKLHDVSIYAILLNDGYLAHELKKLNVNVIIMDEKDSSFIGILYSVFNFLRKHQVEVIHTHRYKENIIGFIVTRFIRNVKLIATQHGLPEFTENKIDVHTIFNKISFFLLSRFFSAVIAVSNELKDVMKKRYGFSSRHLHVIHNGIFVPEVLPICLDKKKFTFGSAGRLVRIKNYKLMIEIASRFKKYRDVQFLLAGDGPELPMLKDLVSSHDLDESFIFIGHAEDMSSFYESIDVFINTSLHEGIPMTILEAMSWAKPVIAPHVGGIPEIITDNVDGYLIEDLNVNSYYKKCEFLYLYQEKTSSIGAAGRNKILQKFSIENSVKKHIMLYKDIFLEI